MATVNNTEGRTIGRGNVLLVILGIIAAILSLLRYPFIFGVIGVIMGILSTKEGSKAGLAVIVLNIILMSIGLIFSDVIWNYFSHYMGINW
jgi:hypothetical protein